MTMYDTGISWGRAKPHLKTGAMRADRHLGPEVHSFHPMGLGQDWLKWEIVVKKVFELRRVASVKQTRLYRMAVRWFRWKPWANIVFFAFTQIPFDAVRVLALSSNCPLRWSPKFRQVAKRESRS